VYSLCSTNANRLVVPSVKLSAVGSRAFAVAAPHIWNTLPTDVVVASSLSTFRRLIKRFLFKQQTVLLRATVPWDRQMDSSIA